MKRVILFVMMTLLLAASRQGGVVFAQSSETVQINACKRVLQKWNEALNSHNAAAANRLYMPVVDYYGSAYVIEQINSSHKKLFTKYPHFQQRISNIQVEVLNSCRTRINFDKHVQTQPGGEYTLYHAYFYFSGYEGGDWHIIRESDTTTDRNLGKRNNNLVSVPCTNSTPLKRIFNPANVGKRVDADYWTLVQNSDDETPGPLARAMSEACDISMRMQMSGEIKKNYRGRKNTYYVDGLVEAGESEFIVVWVYNASTGKLSCIEE